MRARRFLSEGRLIMYERFYGFRERPFSLTPDPSYLYPSRVHREALSHLRYGIEGHAGFTVITGEIGCGKTTLLQTVLRSIDRKTSISRLMNTMLDSRELLEAIMLDFGLDPGQGRSKPYLIRDLARFLVDERKAGRLALLIIDEAQNLSVSALEEVRMLSNLETEKSKLVQIVLVGQPNLRDLLSRPDLEQLRQRVTVNYHIEPLTSDETHAYINHRLRYASLGAPLTFSRDVTDLIHAYSRGVARTINVIADAILLYGYGSDKRVIDLDLTNEVVGDLGLLGGHSSPADDAGRAERENRPAPSPGAVEMPAAADASLRLAPVEEPVANAANAPIRLTADDLVSDLALRKAQGDLPLQAAAPVHAPAPVFRANPSHTILCEVPPRPEGWWARFRRGMSGHPRPAVEA
jgi:putative secretion ATPase (PEP-CTERM system associated)